MRGIYTAAFLGALANEYAQDRGTGPLDIGKGFDLIVGTSTGAIIACAAVAGIPMDRVVALYQEHGRKIFPQKIATGSRVLAQIPLRSWYLRRGAIALQSALEGVLADETIGEVYERRGIGLSIPAVEMSQQKSWVFKTSHWGGHRDDKIRLVDACMATSAAPIYRSLAAIPATDGMRGHRVFADGGLWANNPVLVGLIDAMRFHETRPILVYSVGTLPRPEGRQFELHELDRGFIEWKFGGDAASLSIAAQESAFDYISNFLADEFTKRGRETKVFRFPAGNLQPSMLPYLDLDDTSHEAATALINQARADVNVARTIANQTANPTGQAIRALFNEMPPF